MSNSTKNSTLESQLALTPTETTVLSTYIGAVGFFGILGNSLVIITFHAQKTLQTSTNLFICHLSVCNMLLAIMDLIFSLPSALNHSWVYGQELCNVFGWFYNYLCAISLNTLAAISLDRYWVITKASTRSQITIRFTLFLIFLTCLYTFLPTTPIFFAENIFEEDFFHTGCYVKLDGKSIPGLLYTVFFASFLVLVPFLTMVVCYSEIYSSLRRRSGNVSIYNERRKSLVFFSALHLRTIRMITIVIVAFLCCWCPYVAIFLAMSHGNHLKISNITLEITILLSKLAVVCNPIIYAALNQRFQKAFSESLFHKRHKSNDNVAFSTSYLNSSRRKFRSRKYRCSGSCEKYFLKTNRKEYFTPPNASSAEFRHKSLETLIAFSEANMTMNKLSMQHKRVSLPQVGHEFRMRIEFQNLLEHIEVSLKGHEKEENCKNKSTPSHKTNGSVTPKLEELRVTNLSEGCCKNLMSRTNSAPIKSCIPGKNKGQNVRRRSALT